MKMLYRALLCVKIDTWFPGAAELKSTLARKCVSRVNDILAYREQISILYNKIFGMKSYRKSMGVPIRAYLNHVK
jgi:hypothetical protein